MSDSQKFVQNQATTLAGAGASISDTSLVLTSFTDIDGALLTMTDFGSKGFGTIEPNGAFEEQIVFTGIVQNGNGTATLTGVSNVLFLAPYTETSGLFKAHAGGTTFVISNTSGFYNDLTGKNNDETITGTWTFTSPNYPRMNTATPPPTDDEQFATKKYVDDVAIQGAPDATEITKGITKLSVAAVSPTNPIAVGDNDTRVPTQSENDALPGTVGTPSGTNKYVTNDDTTGTGSVLRESLLTSAVKFGGNGSDGALVVSGTTTISLGSATEVIKNYTTLTIDGGALLNFSNAHTNGTRTILRVQGDVTISGTIDVSDLGAAAGVGSSAGGFSFSDGADGSPTLRAKYVKLTAGGGYHASTGTGGAAGTKDFAYDFLSSTTYPTEIANVYEFVLPGSGGGGAGSSGNGGGGTGVGGAGGKGGGALLIECGGALNFSPGGVLSANGANGVNGSTPSGSFGGGGGGGGGGSILVLYNILTDNSGSVSVAGGAGGSGGGNLNGGGGASIATIGTGGGAGNGNGGAGLSIIRQNIVRA